jgi:hypothetical protein
VSLSPRRSTSPTAAVGRRTARVAAGLLSVVLLSMAAACGFDVQTNRPYTPAQGVNYNVGTPPVQVRNLMVLSREDGQGFVSATLAATDQDSLTSVAGVPIKPDYTPGEPFTVSLGGPVALPIRAIVGLTNRKPLITVASPDLQLGGEAELTLTFATAGAFKTRVPIVNADEEPYATISPATAAE